MTNLIQYSGNRCQTTTIPCVYKYRFLSQLLRPVNHWWTSCCEPNQQVAAVVFSYSKLLLCLLGGALPVWAPDWITLHVTVLLIWQRTQGNNKQDKSCNFHHSFLTALTRMQLASGLNATLPVPFPESTPGQTSSQAQHKHAFAHPWCSHAFLIRVINNVQTGSGYLQWSSLAEKSLLCPARCWILALGPAPSAEVDTGHIGSWLPQLSLSLVKEKMECFQWGAVNTNMLVETQHKVCPIHQMRLRYFVHCFSLFTAHSRHLC